MRLASRTRRMLITASMLGADARSDADAGTEPAVAAASLAPWADQPAGSVIEFPSTAQVTDAIGELSDPSRSIRLIELICVVDAAHLIDDLAVDDFLVSARDALGAPIDYVARSSITVTQIEYASRLVIVGWEAVPTPELSTIMALLSALAPHARLRLDQGGVDPVGLGASYQATQDRAGWMGILNSNADPHMTDPRVHAFHYEQLRPFHPARLAEVLMRRLDTGEFGRVIRSAGFCRLASRPGTTLQWDHVGRTLAFHLFPPEFTRKDPDAEPLAIGQDLAFIGIDLDLPALGRALDLAALTDAELTEGPQHWRTYPDPFPAQETAEGPFR